MAKISGKYETIFIVNPKLEEAAATAVVDKFKSLVEANGTNVEVEDWGKRVWRTRSRIRRRGSFTRWFVLSPSPISRLSWTVSTRSRTASCVPSSSAWTTKAVNTNAQ